MKNGFRKICRSFRFVGKIAGHNHGSVRQAGADDLQNIFHLDKKRFGADRTFFLERRIRLFEPLCLVVEDYGRVAGYIMAQPGRGVMSVGPWLACGEEDARKLIETLASKTTGGPLRIGVLESNSPAVGLVRSFESFHEQTRCWRMVRGNGEGLGHHADLYGIGSAAKG